LEILAAIGVISILAIISKIFVFLHGHKKDKQEESQTGYGKDPRRKKKI
jgi:hypothetical protein